MMAGTYVLCMAPTVYQLQEKSTSSQPHPINAAKGQGQSAEVNRPA